MKPMGLILVGATLLPSLALANGDASLKQYSSQGAGPFDAQRGKQAWMRKFPATDGSARSCASCHGSDPTTQGKHARTGKAITPMAPSTEPKRLTDPKKVEKWFLRNCKWAWGRTCSAQEKGDFIAYLNRL
jgi:hypothetical protein